MRRRGRVRSHSIRMLGLLERHAERVRAHRRSYLVLLVERDGGERSEREREVEV